MAVVKESLVFSGEQDGYRFTAWYLTEPKGDALVTISKDGATVKEFLWPAYKVWNIAAHAGDIVADMEYGLALAGSDGLGGGVAPQPLPDAPTPAREEP